MMEVIKASCYGVTGFLVYSLWRAAAVDTFFKMETLKLFIKFDQFYNSTIIQAIVLKA